MKQVDQFYKTEERVYLFVHVCLFLGVQLSRRRRCKWPRPDDEREGGREEGPVLNVVMCDCEFYKRKRDRFKKFLKSWR